MGMQPKTIFQQIFKISGIVLFCTVTLLFLYPLLWLADSSFRPWTEVASTVPFFVEKNPIEAISSYNLKAMTEALIGGEGLTKWNVGLAFINSVWVTIAAILLTIVVCSFAAYAFAYLNFPFKKPVFVIVIATMMLPMTTMVVPYYLLLNTLGLIDNPLGLIIPYAASAFSIFLLRQYFVKVPFSYIESARMEGSSEFRILFSIIMPLARPAIAAMAIIQFRLVWNDFLYPMLILKTQEFFTLPIIIKFMDSKNIDKPYDVIVATGFIAVSVPLIFFLIFQRQFIEGLTGGLKQ
ncbi:MAG: carbohydrate ABC transporter permease [Spirochaetales bacterium]|nr:carbohydrate ABC transporter permease [Spirochaetales bacterium]